MCFASEETVFWLFESLKHDILDDNFFTREKNIYYLKEKETLKNINDKLKISGPENLVSEFLEICSIYFIENLLINTVSFQITFNTLEKMIKKGSVYKYLKKKK